MRTLEEELLSLIYSKRKQVFAKYKRINPITENLIDWKEKGEFLFGKGCNITVYDTSTIVGDVKVGNNTWIGPYTSLDGSGGLKIGQYCSISSNVNIITHDSVLWALSGGKKEYEMSPIEIGDYCFIGTGATITKGVKVGNHCIIGAGAVVTRDIPEKSIATGVPAKVVGKVVISGNDIELKFNKI